MFNWNANEMKLRRSVHHIGRNIDFSENYTVSTEDKIEFVDRMNDGMLTYILDLYRKFQEDAPLMPKDKWHNVKSQSLIAWCKRNDPKKVIDRDYKYGHIRFLGTDRWIQHGQDQKGPYDSFDRLIDESFHRQLRKCLTEEDIYFKSTDEYEVAKTNLCKYIDKYHTTFGMRLSFCSDGAISVVSDEDHFHGPDITLDQCNFLIGLYKELEKKIEELTATCTAAYM